MNPEVPSKRKLQRFFKYLQFKKKKKKSFFLQNASFVSTSLDIVLLKCMGNEVTAISLKNIYQAFLVMLSSVDGIFVTFSKIKHVVCYCEMS